MTYEISPNRTRPNPTNSGWTIPRTWGVWDIGSQSAGKRFRYGNYPIRGAELLREYDRPQLISLYTNRAAAKSNADSRNS